LKISILSALKLAEYVPISGAIGPKGGGALLLRPCLYAHDVKSRAITIKTV